MHFGLGCDLGCCFLLVSDLSLGGVLSIEKHLEIDIEPDLLPLQSGFPRSMTVSNPESS